MIIKKFLNKKVLCISSIVLLFLISCSWLAKEKELAMTSSPFYEGLSGKNAVAICINVDFEFSKLAF